MQSQSELSSRTATVINIPLHGSHGVFQQNPTVKEIGRSRCQVLRYLLKLKRAVDAQHNDLIETLTQRFVEAVTDYISYGHFRLLTTFDAAGHLSAAMDQNTRAILNFTDSYQTGYGNNLQRLTHDLETLAWQIEARFDIEDEIVYH